MIKQITSACDLSTLREGHYKRKMISNYEAYGTGYDFCRFYEVLQDGEQAGTVCVFNSSLTAESVEGKSFNADTIEALSFMLRVNRPCTAELSPEYAREVCSRVSELYSIGERHEFEFACRGIMPALDVEELPRLDDVFDILKTGFPNLTESYELWLTDTSHRVRRGYSQAFILNGCTTATIQYIVDGKALVGQVATLPDMRGRYYARQLLYWIGERLSRDGLTVLLFARNHRRSYYEEIGFRKTGTDYVLDLRQGSSQ